MEGAWGGILYISFSGSRVQFIIKAGWFTVLIKKVSLTAPMLTSWFMKTPLQGPIHCWDGVHCGFVDNLGEVSFHSSRWFQQDARAARGVCRRHTLCLCDGKSILHNERFPFSLRRAFLHSQHVPQSFWLPPTGPEWKFLQTGFCLIVCYGRWRRNTDSLWWDVSS